MSTSVSNTHPTLVCGICHTLCITNDKKVISFGFSDCGAHGFIGRAFPPKIIPSLKNIKSIVGGDHTLCLDYEGNVFVFGSNLMGQLGLGIDGDCLEYVSEPRKIDLPSPCKQVSCGEYFSLCLTEDGLVYSFGCNGDGQLGIGNNEENYNSPQLISSLKDVEFIACGGYHIFCKTLNNEIYCWGFNYHGQLGLGNRDNQNTPILCSSLSNEDIIDIKCAEFHTLVLTSNGDVLSCGSNEYRQLGRETDDNYSSSIQKIPELSDITKIDCGYFHSMGIGVCKNVFIWGNNALGILGLGDYSNRVKPIEHPSLSNVIDMSNGGMHTFIKTSSNEIFAFGHNVFSQLGSITTERTVLLPIRVFEGNEDIWFSDVKSKAKSARSILPKPLNEEDNSPPKKKQKTE